MLIRRLGTHYEFSGSQRLVLSYMWQRAEVDPTDFCLVSIDKMDQTKTCIPRVQHLLTTTLMKDSPRLVVGLIGAYIPGVFTNPLVTTLFDDCIHGGDMQTSIVLNYLMAIKLKLGKLPKTFVIHADNTVKD